MALAARTCSTRVLAGSSRRMAVAPVSRRAVIVRAEVPTKESAPTKEPAAVEAAVKAAQSGQQWMLAQPGISAPTGTPGKSYFDPFGFTASTQFSVDEGKRFRESELTHGRVAMLATLGWLVAEQFHPLFGGQIEGPAFVHFQKVETIWPQFWEIILFAIGLCEAYRIGVSYNDPRMVEQIKENHQPGDLGFDPLGFYPKDKAVQFDLRTKELNNGRLAMIAIAGFAAQEEVDHKTIWKGLFPEGVDPAPPAAFPPY